MALPFFYAPSLHAGSLTLDEDTSKHITGVLRMKNGAALMLTDGKGTRAEAVIVDGHRKHCVVTIPAITNDRSPLQSVSIAISPVKNNARFEWFLEKATEIGVQQIIPLICERTIREKFRHDRMNNILISAMLQSQQSFLPQLTKPMLFADVLAMEQVKNRLIAHCLPHQKELLQQVPLQQSNIILIGPEGDFTEPEISTALSKGFKPVSLGATRLRTETAGIAAAVLMCHMRVQ